jgi:RNA polymerase sigma factor (sigma-70 family)
MVLGICRRVLRDEHAAEDAFQATFLVLVKKAGALRDRNLLTNWLYGVALRVASKERAKGARRRMVEREAAAGATDALEHSDELELRSVIDEEIRRLPERYRLPLVLCHLEGLRHDEVAHRIGCPLGTVESRLSRAREQLRTRLARRGLAPSASALGAILRPLGTTTVPPSLVEATLCSAVGYSARRTLAGAGTISAWTWAKRTAGFIPTFRTGAVASTLVACAAAAVLGLVVYKADGKSTKVDSNKAQSQSLISPQANQPGGANASPQFASRDASTARRNPGQPEKRREPVRSTRSPSAIAPALTGITIDGRLDDWPTNLERHPVKNQLLDHPSYNSEPITADDDSSAYFMAGYDPKIEKIYLAVVVRDKDVVVHPSDVLQTDSVEIYIDGAFSKKAVSRLPSGDWRESFDAATMPVLQYVAVPGHVPAYGDRWSANPSLVYARSKETATAMQYQRIGDVITYEWSVKAYDRFPDRPTRLYPGKRLGLEVAIVDKDLNGILRKRPPTFLTWGAPPLIFKGADAGSLGELVLAEATERSPREE